MLAVRSGKKRGVPAGAAGTLAVLASGSHPAKRSRGEDAEVAEQVGSGFALSRCLLAEHVWCDCISRHIMPQPTLQAPCLPCQPFFPKLRDLATLEPHPDPHPMHRSRRKCANGRSHD